jgi:two-component system chemotaxis response regulator CheB
MPRRDIVVVGCSAGGVETLRRFVALLPEDLPAAVFIVMHLAPHSAGALPNILKNDGPLPAASPADGDPIKEGHIYVAPPDHHLLIEPGRIRVVRGPKENRNRPAIDPLFRSAAWSHGPRVIGVVLTGTLDDGTSGMWAIKSCGGVTVVQDPDDALYREMPAAVLAAMEVDHRVKLDDLGTLLARLTREDSQGAPIDPTAASRARAETEYVEMRREIEEMGELGKPAGFTCPTCHGSLWELKDGELVRYRCHVGHAFSPESLTAEADSDVEMALYSALRAMEENAEISRRIALRYGEKLPTQSKRHEEKAAELDRSADVLRQVLARRNGA